MMNFLKIAVVFSSVVMGALDGSVINLTMIRECDTDAPAPHAHDWVFRRTTDCYQMVAPGLVANGKYAKFECIRWSENNEEREFSLGLYQSWASDCQDSGYLYTVTTTNGQCGFTWTTASGRTVTEQVMFSTIPEDAMNDFCAHLGGGGIDTCEDHTDCSTGSSCINNVCVVCGDIGKNDCKAIRPRISCVWKKGGCRPFTVNKRNCKKLKADQQLCEDAGCRYKVKTKGGTQKTKCLA